MSVRSWWACGARETVKRWELGAVTMRESFDVINREFLLVFIILLACLLMSCHKSNPVPPYGDQPVYPQIDAYPAWSPDGKEIIYNHYGITRVDVGGSYSVDTDSAGLWIIGNDGYNPRLLLKGDDINASWSPDGKWIAFENGAQIYKAPIDSNGVDVLRITQLTFAGRNFFPAWSPDGEWIAYNQSICDNYLSCGIWLISSNGDLRTFLAAYGNFPDWLPAGAKLIYVGPRSEVYRIDISDTSVKTRLTSFNQSDPYNKDDRYPKYSPEGLKIVFESNANIWVMDSDGTNLKQLTTDGGMQPSWSRVGDKIAYIGFTQQPYDPQNNGTVWIMNMDGSERHQLTHGPGQK